MTTGNANADLKGILERGGTCAILIHGNRVGPSRPSPVPNRPGRVRARSESHGRPLWLRPPGTGSHADRSKNREEEMCEATECVSTAVCAGRDAASFTRTHTQTAAHSVGRGVGGGGRGLSSFPLGELFSVVATERSRLNKINKSLRHPATL